MTTIAWDGETLATDSQSTRDNGQTFYQSKIVVQKKGVAAIGCDASLAYAALLLIEEFTERNEWPPIDLAKNAQWDGLHIICVPYGIEPLLEFFDSLYPFVLPRDQQYAWGTGGPYALAAMHLGRSATEAVGIARQLDVYTGGDIHTHDDFLNPTTQ
jgi:hypothetical protein